MTEPARLFRRPITLILLTIAVVAGALGTSWTLPMFVSQGQTIPLPTKTSRPKPTSPPPTEAPPPSATSTHAPEATAAGLPALDLEITVQADRPAAGPGDAVHFLVRLASVGSAAADNVRLSGALPDALQVLAIECAQCAESPGYAPVRASLGPLAPGSQATITVAAQVRDDAWPGQTLQTTWQATADALPAQTAQAAVELPWAELPATGLVAGQASGSRYRGSSSR